MFYERQRKPISYFGVPWDAWAEKADQPVADPADDGFFVPDSSHDLFWQLCPGVAGYPMRTVRRVAIPEIIGYGHDAAQVRDNLPASAKASTAIQDGIVLGADNGLAGGIGTVDSAFAQLGRIVPISGNFPAQPDEIAMTTTLLDALGCSYDLGQTITLKVADNDYDPLSGSGKIVEQTYTLCGVLPAYDVYWNLGSNLTVSAVVAEPLALAGQKFQTFYDLNADTVGTARMTRISLQMNMPIRRKIRCLLR